MEGFKKLEQINLLVASKDSVYRKSKAKSFFSQIRNMPKADL